MTSQIDGMSFPASTDAELLKQNVDELELGGPDFTAVE